MPAYDYKCKKCEKVYELEHKPKDLQMKYCPSCGGELKRVYNVGGIVFKGSGFYVTDNRSSSSDTKPDTKASKS